MTPYITNNWLPWIVSVVMSFVLSQYLNQLSLLQYSVQVHFSYPVKYIHSYKTTVTSKYRMNESNETTSEQPTMEPNIRTFAEDLLTPVQLKDFGKYPKNRTNCLLFIILRV